ncbi:hypothetical protein LDENG_00232850 [Lucifuga dentata]|nr:hypothetical protein LDENG_00232850 [Lucifuga dentata]
MVEGGSKETSSLSDTLNTPHPPKTPPSFAAVTPFSHPVPPSGHFPSLSSLVSFNSSFNNFSSARVKGVFGLTEAWWEVFPLKPKDVLNSAETQNYPTDSTANGKAN